jgi:hypothetical protein
MNEPTDIARAIIDNIEAALEEFRRIAADLAVRDSGCSA